MFYVKTLKRIEKTKNKEVNNSKKKTTISNKNYVSAHYLITFNYKTETTDSRGFIQGGTQCSSLRLQIVDLNNKSEIVATFNYIGNFDIDPLADAISKKLFLK